VPKRTGKRASRNRKNPSTHLFWNDLRQALSRCSPAAKGLWAVHMLPCAAESAEYGVVLVGNHPSPRAAVGGLLCYEFGLSADATQELIEELIEKGVAEVDDRGRVCCRRMVREEAARQAKIRAGRSGGKASGAVRNAKQTPKQTPQQSVSGDASTTRSTNPSNVEADRQPSDPDGTSTNQDLAEAETKQEESEDRSSPPSTDEPSSFFSLPSKKVDRENHTVETLAPSGACVTPKVGPHDDVKAVVDLWDQYAAEIPKWPATRGISNERRSAIRARLKEHGFDGIRAALERAKASHFIREVGMRGWNLGWLMNPTNFLKVIEGTYDGDGSDRATGPPSRMSVFSDVVSAIGEREWRHGE